MTKYFILFAAIVILAAQCAKADVVDRTVVQQICKNTGFSDCKLVNALAKYESGYKPKKFNPEKTGSMGLLQIQCGTAKMLGYKDCNKLYDIRHNILVGVHYLRDIRARHKIKDVRTWLAAYNAGKPYICKFYNPGFCNPGEFYNQQYVDEVYAIYQSLDGAQNVTGL